MVESSLFTFFSRLAQACVWTKTKGFYQSCTLRFWPCTLRLQLQNLTGEYVCSYGDRDKHLCKEYKAYIFFQMPNAINTNRIKKKTYTITSVQKLDIVVHTNLSLCKSILFIQFKTFSVLK